jgi:hypothetical protein
MQWVVPQKSYQGDEKLDEEGRKLEFDRAPEKLLRIEWIFENLTDPKQAGHIKPRKGFQLFSMKIFCNLFVRSFIFCSIISCGSKKSEDIPYKVYGKNFVGEEEYSKVYNRANDSIKFWAFKKLENYDENENGFYLDSIVCFNLKKDKSVMALAQQDFRSEANSDYMQFFFGVKFAEQWFFFKGPNIVLPREYYQSDTRTPLSFEKLHEIAMKEIFSGYLKKDKDGEWQINDRFFDQVVPKSNEPVSSGFGECFTCKGQEEYVMYIVRKNWQYRDTTKMEKPGHPS